jgi:hypothetical protein
MSASVELPSASTPVPDIAVELPAALDRLFILVDVGKSNDRASKDGGRAGEFKLLPSNEEASECLSFVALLITLAFDDIVVTLLSPLLFSISIFSTSSSYSVALLLLFVFISS